MVMYSCIEAAPENSNFQQHLEVKLQTIGRYFLYFLALTSRRHHDDVMMTSLWGHDNVWTTFQCENAFEETGEWKMNYEAGMNCDEAADLETESDLTIELV